MDEQYVVYSNRHGALLPENTPSVWDVLSEADGEEDAQDAHPPWPASTDAWSAARADARERAQSLQVRRYEGAGQVVRVRAPV